MAQSRGKLRIRKTYGDVGLIQRSTGTNDSDEFKRIEEALDYCFKHRIYGAIRAVRDRKKTPKEILEMKEKGTLHTFNWDLGHQSLRNAFSDWLEPHTDLADTTKVSYRNYISRLLKQGSNDSVISDLPDILKLYRVRCGRSKKYHIFNRARAVCMAFVRDTVKKSKNSELYETIQEVPIFKKKLLKRQVPPRPFNTPYELRKLLNDSKDPFVKKYAEHVLFMCLHGFRAIEYHTHPWRKEKGYLHIVVTKTDDDRQVPLLMEPPAIRIKTYKTLHKLLKKLGRTPHDTRRTYQTWLAEAGIDRAHSRFYMGHKVDSMTTLYKQTNKQIEEWIPPDRRRLKAWYKRVKDIPPVEFDEDEELITL